VHIVIMGCGRVGSSIAHSLEDQGHSVAVIDQDPEAFRKLRSGFKGTKVTGVGCLGLSAAWHPDGGHGGLDSGPDAAQADT